MYCIFSNARWISILLLSLIFYSVSTLRIVNSQRLTESKSNPEIFYWNNAFTKEKDLKAKKYRDKRATMSIFEIAGVSTC